MNPLLDLLETNADTTMVLGRVTQYVTQYAPRFSAYLLMQEALQFFVEKRAFSSAGALLNEVRVYFPDTLPQGCNSNFDFQTRAKPFIDGLIPLLKKPLEKVVLSPVYNVNTPEGDEGNPVLTQDGKTMYFSVSGRPDNKRPNAGKDVYVSVNQNGAWSTPAGLGAGINTDKQEAAPFLHADGKTLYYTSTGYPGLGKSDVFLSYRLGESWTRWSRPVNLGKEINDTRQHTGFGHVTVDGGSAFYTRNKKEDGKGDIWETRLPADGRN